MLHDILLALWFFLPIGGANAVPVLAAKLPVLKNWNTPFDFGYKWRGRPILGQHKTWRGLASGMFAATIIFWAQQYLVGQWNGLADLTAGLDYQTLPVLIVGPLFAVGTLGGDALKSFFKRLRGIPPGQKWFPFDQLDVFGGAIAVMPFMLLNTAQYLWLLIVCFLAQLVFSYIGYLIGLKERPI